MNKHRNGNLMLLVIVPMLLGSIIQEGPSKIDINPYHMAYQDTVIIPPESALLEIVKEWILKHPDATIDNVVNYANSQLATTGWNFRFGVEPYLIRENRSLFYEITDILNWDPEDSNFTPLDYTLPTGDVIRFQIETHQPGDFGVQLTIPIVSITEQVIEAICANSTVSIAIPDGFQVDNVIIFNESMTEEISQWSAPFNRGPPSGLSKNADIIYFSRQFEPWQRDTPELLEWWKQVREDYWSDKPYLLVGISPDGRIVISNEYDFVEKQETEVVWDVPTEFDAKLGMVWRYQIEDKVYMVWWPGMDTA